MRMLESIESEEDVPSEVPDIPAPVVVEEPPRAVDNAKMMMLNLFEQFKCTNDAPFCLRPQVIAKKL